ncbi:hypothetical protein, partial [Longispora fulva]
DSFNGNNYGANFKAGAEYLLNSNFGLALEAGYNTGSYNQNYQADTDSQKESYEVSVQGLEVGLSLRYRFSAQ